MGIDHGKAGRSVSLYRLAVAVRDGFLHRVGDLHIVFVQRQIRKTARVTVVRVQGQILGGRKAVLVQPDNRRARTNAVRVLFILPDLGNRNRSQTSAIGIVDDIAVHGALIGGHIVVQRTLHHTVGNGLAVDLGKQVPENILPARTRFRVDPFLHGEGSVGQNPDIDRSRADRGIRLLLPAHFHMEIAVPGRLQGVADNNHRLLAAAALDDGILVGTGDIFLTHGIVHRISVLFGRQILKHPDVIAALQKIQRLRGIHTVLLQSYRHGIRTEAQGVVVVTPVFHHSQRDLTRRIFIGDGVYARLGIL